jgi:hypothetical protein
MRRGRGDDSSRRVQQESRVSLWSPRAWLNVVDLYKRRAHHKTASVRALHQSTSVGHTTPVSSEHLGSVSPNTRHQTPTSTDHYQPSTSSDCHQVSTLTFADHETSVDYHQTSTVIGYPVTSTTDTNYPQASTTTDTDHPQASTTTDTDHPQASTTTDTDHPQASTTTDTDHPQASTTTGRDHPQASTTTDTDHPLAFTTIGRDHPQASTTTDTDHPLDSITGTTNQASTIKDRQQTSTFTDQYHDFTTASYNQVAFTSKHRFTSFSSQDDTLLSQFQLNSEENVVSEQNTMTSSGDVDLAIDQHPTDLPLLQHQAGTTRNQLSDTISEQNQTSFLIADMNSNVQQATNLSVQQTNTSSSKLQTSTYGVQQHSSDATFIIQTTSTITPFLQHKSARSKIQHKILESARVQHETSTPSSFQQKSDSSFSSSQHTTPTTFGFQHKIFSPSGSQHEYLTPSSSQVRPTLSSTSQRVSPSSSSTQQLNSGTRYMTASSFRIEHKTVRTQHLPRVNQIKDVTSKRSQVTPTTPRAVVRPMHVISVKDSQKTWRHDVTSHNKTLMHHRDYHSINSALGKLKLLLTFFKMSAINCSPCCIRLLLLLFCNIYVQHHATLQYKKICGNNMNQNQTLLTNIRCWLAMFGFGLNFICVKAAWYR